MYIVIGNGRNSDTLKPLYETIYYTTVSDIRAFEGLKVDPKSVVPKQKCIHYMEKNDHLGLYSNKKL